MFTYLSKDSIIRVNRLLHTEFGGGYLGENNLKDEDALNSLLYFTCHPEYHPSLEEKAALYLFRIIDNHIFYEGCKRTGLACAALFMQMNFMTFSEAKDNEYIMFATDIAKGLLTYENTVDMLKKLFIPMNEEERNEEMKRVRIISKP